MLDKNRGLIATSNFVSKYCRCFVEANLLYGELFPLWRLRIPSIAAIVVVRSMHTTRRTHCAVKNVRVMLVFNDIDFATSPTEAV